MFELKEGIPSIVETCIGLKPGERVLIITDNEAEPAIWARTAN